MASWTRLANELLYAIFDHLPNSDRKNLRLACRFVYAVTPLLFDRVYISSFRKDLDVLRSVAAHPAYRTQVKELVWDDTELRLPDFCPFCNSLWVGSTRASLLEIGFHKALIPCEPTHGDCPEEVEAQAIEGALHLLSRLYDEQQEVIRSGEDIETFRLALASFPFLHRVTIAGHDPKRSHLPHRYRTPLIRSLPDCITVVWPFWGPVPRIVHPDVAILHRSYGIVARELAETTGNISEIVVDPVCMIDFGRLLSAPPWDSTWNNLRSLVARDSLKVLDLSLNVNLFVWPLWITRQFGCDLFKTTLSAARNLEHFRLRVNTAKLVFQNRPVSLIDLIPVEDWPMLRSLSLQGIGVRSENFVQLLSALPPTIVSLEFNRVCITDSTWGLTLPILGYRLGWLRYPSPMPIVTIRVRPQNYLISRYVELQEDLRRFYEGSGPNPFTPTETTLVSSGRIVQPGFGRLRDEFDESFDEPWNWHGDSDTSA